MRAFRRESNNLKPHLVPSFSDGSSVFEIGMDAFQAKAIKKPHANANYANAHRRSQSLDAPLKLNLKPDAKPN